MAHRTSPTNMGLYLLSTVAARDFGWLGTLEAVERMEATLATMHQLELFRGHFFNWYDTRDLRPLEPKYVSSVDSGNLAGHLLVLGNSCRELVQKSSIDARMLDRTARFDFAVARSAGRQRRTRRRTPYGHTETSQQRSRCACQVARIGACRCHGVGVAVRRVAGARPDLG